MTGFLIDFENKLLRQTDRHKSIDNAVYADLEYSIYSLMGRKTFFCLLRTFFISINIKNSRPTLFFGLIGKAQYRKKNDETEKSYHGLQSMCCIFQNSSKLLVYMILQGLPQIRNISVICVVYNFSKFERTQNFKMRSC